VSNGVPAAESGELTIMVGGTKEQYERALPLLRLLGNNIYHMGPTGSGNIAKVSNQVIYLSYVAVFCEIAKLGREAGMDVPQLIDCMRKSVAGAPLMTHWEDRLLNGDRVAGFAIERLLKDMDLCGEIFREEGVPAPVFESARQTYREVAEHGGEHLDMTAIYSR
jgi:3-hydroxyisobutyrate dehydrogenase